MKLIIEIPEMAYDAYKEWHKNKVATVEQSLIANGIPYEEKPQGDLISREALKKHIAETFEIEEKIDKKWAMGLKYSLKIIDLAPAVEVTKPQSYVMGFCDGLKAQIYEKPPMFEKPQGKSEKWKCCECYIRAKETGALLFCEAVGKCKFEKGGAE